MVTALGKFLRKLRVDNEELMKNMADNLGISSSMLSAIENGKRNPPAGFAGRVEKAYQLASDQVESLLEAMSLTQDEVRISLTGRTEADANLAFSFARRFDDLDDASKEDIMKILKRGEA